MNSIPCGKQDRFPFIRSVGSALQEWPKLKIWPNNGHIFDNFGHSGNVNFQIAEGTMEPEVASTVVASLTREDFEDDAFAFGIGIGIWHLA